MSQIQADAGQAGVILGVANNRSIAGACQGMPRRGAEIALTWQGDALKKRVEPLPGARRYLLGHCDVTDPAPSTRSSRARRKNGSKIDSWFTPSLFPTRTSSTAATSRPPPIISPRHADHCYSLTAIAQRAEKLMTDGGSIF
jgi:enoyl-[acyl-carrier protein] reductase I